MHDIWNPWHGCKKCSEGCQNCYMYYLDGLRGQSGADIYRTKAGFRYPLSRDRSGRYKVQSGEIEYCPHGRPVKVKLTQREIDGVTFQVLNQQRSILLAILRNNIVDLLLGAPDYLQETALRLLNVLFRSLNLVFLCELRHQRAALDFAHRIFRTQFLSPLRLRIRPRQRIA